LTKKVGINYLDQYITKGVTRVFIGHEMYTMFYCICYYKKIAANRRVYGSDRGKNPEVTSKLSGPISAKAHPVVV